MIPYTKVHKSMKEEEESIGRNEYERIATTSKTTDYVVMDKDYYQELNQNLSQILIGSSKKINPDE